MSLIGFKYFLLVLTIDLLTETAKAITGSAGWFVDGNNGVHGDDSCKTGADSTGCLTCEAYMYYDSTTKKGAFCADGQYYDSTYQVCRNGDGKGTGSCKGQKSGFACTSPQVLDIESLKCIDSGDSPKMLVESSQYSLGKICRSLSYYVDSSSSEMVELGTIAYPYRSFRAISSDILNNFSHQNVAILVHLKENTDTYISDLSNYFLNITSVKITSYSLNSTS